MSWESNVRRVVPYVPGEQPNIENMIKLNTNENPYPPSKGVQEAMKNLQLTDFKLYPDSEAGSLVHTLAQYYGLEDDRRFGKTAKKIGFADRKFPGSSFPPLSGAFCTE